MNARWTLVRGPDFVPVLCRLLDRPGKAALPDAERLMEALQELDPGEFRRRVIVEMRKPKSAVHPRVLARLPDVQLPELEHSFLRHASAQPWLFGHLIARYGTARILPEVRNLFAQGHWRWGFDTVLPFYAYMIRVAPAEGQRLLREALFSNYYGAGLLARVAALHYNPAVETLALELLESPDARKAADAAHALQRYGSAAVEAPLWTRLDLWLQQWRGRERELLGDPVTGQGERPDEIRLRRALIDAIARGQGWFFDEPRRQRMHTMCPDEDCRASFARQSGTNPYPVTVKRDMYSEPWFEVGGYSVDSVERLKAKLAQFPSGSRFAWCTEREGGGGELQPYPKEHYRQAIRAFVELRGSFFEANPGNSACRY